MTPENDPLIRAARQLPRDIEPPRDLWPEIAAALDEPRRDRSRAARGRVVVPWYYALAATVASIALGGLITLSLVNQDGAATGGQETSPDGMAASSEVPMPGRASIGTYAVLGPDYERARAELAIGLAERIDRLPPPERQKIERNLHEIQRAVREINVALQLDPDSALLRELLLSTYQQELAMLANVNQMAGALPARTDT